MATVFLNGRFVDRDQAVVSAFDAGLQHGVGLFETMLGSAGAPARDGEPVRAWVHRLEDHLERLVASARELGLSDRLRAPALADAVVRTVEKAALPRARVRLTVTGGDLNLLRREEPPRPVDPTILIVAQPATEYPSEWFQRGVLATIADLRINPLDPFVAHKTLNYWPRLRELQSAAARGAGEALVFSVTNHLAGGCVSNAFLVRNDELWTPIARGEETGEGAPAPRGVAVPSAVLPGVARLAVLEAAPALGLRPVRRMIAIADILSADEVILTNSSWGVLPVVQVERERIGSGAVGPVAQRLREAWNSSLDDTSE